MKTVKVECCADQEAADWRKGVLKTMGYEVIVRDNSAVVSAVSKSKGNYESENPVFDGQECAFVVIGYN